MKRYLSFSVVFCILLLTQGISFAQVDIVELDNPVYDFLQRMQIKKKIVGYNSANLPLSGYEVGNFLKQLNEKRKTLSQTDKDLLDYYDIEFEKDVYGTVNKQSSLFSNFDLEKIFDNKKQKHLYVYNDSNAVFYVDYYGNLSYRTSSGDSLGSHSILLGNGGFGVSGTLFNSVGFSLKAYNGAKLSGDSSDFQFARQTDKTIYANGNTYDFNNKTYYDYYTGYLRYQTATNWFGLSVGRYQLTQGTGFMDKLFLSENSVPFDFAKVDLKYKAISYSFLYGSLRGDSLGVELNSKNIATHNLDIRFSEAFKVGFFESVIITNSSFSFTFLNPISLLISAELNKASQGDAPNVNNNLMGFDAEVVPVKNLAFQGSMIIDDLQFSSLFSDSSEISNKFGFQFGTYWTDAFTVPDLTLKLEYTRLNPFVYAHKSNKAQYTNWNLPLGPNLPPNSDQIAAGLYFNYGSRVKTSLVYQHQRSGEGIILDSAGNVVINYGGNINNGTGESNVSPKFLAGNRVNRDIITFNLSWEPIRQYFINFMYVHRLINNEFESRELNDDYFFATFQVNY
ncbi:MAG: hypothetical protein KDC73_04220 [Ignavibacteriae bacterium]|nr:hypothetical protein [Ignavibacteriota bacterium]MCB9244073.1 hypothetical protein [Ignavibacteriales bacterium]